MYKQNATVQGVIFLKYHKKKQRLNIQNSVS